jgi:hypothetical protein
MTEPHEAAHEAAEQAEHHSANKKIALLIAILALFLAFSETLGKSSQTNALSQNVEASNLWAFFQAKTIRATQVRTAADAMALETMVTTDPAIKAAREKQIDAWKKTAERYDTEPSTGEGRKELAERAKHAEEHRDHSLAKYHNFELASAAFQVAIVLASATIITGMVVLSYLSIALGIGGLAFMAIGLLSPHLIHAVPFIGGH